MTGGANNQRFAPSLSHFLYPSRLLFSSFLFEVGELANMMHFFLAELRPGGRIMVRKQFPLLLGMSQTSLSGLPDVSLPTSSTVRLA